MNRRFLPPQDYGPLFTPEQVAAIRAARQRANGGEPPQEPETFSDKIARKTEHQTTVIEHTDRNGKTWRFVLNCTEEQADNLKRILAGFRTIGRGVLSLTAILNADDNAEFYRGLEYLFLSGLSRRYPQQSVEASTPTNPERTPRTTQAATPQCATSEQRENGEEPPKYWWQND